ncbi:hypothetical protein APS56_07655 [Pseudalgibacter alginicilyticus]|uniref:Uncharacterized protein n=1 Tax=Pseudalgibacter alginicilyticus TaxID=1736674 RepID=A0A0P0CKQ9_9FLAO|nr:alpha/beta hydrolase-fold protein [Pseudalgibacter alginicilyticus]ALJ05005.1 hypothetical protein APS56_07655 [Pseudalgibacter alginicilyticus]
MKKLLYILIVCITVFKTFGQAKIEIGEKHSFFSSVLDENRNYWIYLPPNYNDTIYAPEKYPVVYFLDGERHFHSLTGIQDFLSIGPYASLPHMIYVGVLTSENRSRDLTPTEVSKPQTEKGFVFSNTGGNEKFLEFVASELIPEINKKYRTNGYKTLIGHSFGGLAVFNTLLTKPQLFNAYIAIDPSVWWDNEYILNKIRTELDDLNLKGKRLYIAQANNTAILDDDIQIQKAIISVKKELEKHPNSLLKWTYRFFDDDDHGTVSLPSEYYGLRYIFEGYQLDVKKIAIQPELLVESFNEFNNEIGYEFLPNESVIDDIAKYCIRTQKTRQAVQLFKINQKYYSNSINAYMSLGDYYTGILDFDSAKKEYNKALKLKPTSKLVLEKLKMLN